MNKKILKKFNKTKNYQYYSLYLHFKSLKIGKHWPETIKKNLTSGKSLASCERNCGCSKNIIQIDFFFRHNLRSLEASNFF